MTTHTIQSSTPLGRALAIGEAHRIAEFVRQHGAKARVVGGAVEVALVFTRADGTDGMLFETVHTLGEARAALGY